MNIEAHQNIMNELYYRTVMDGMDEEIREVDQEEKELQSLIDTNKLSHQNRELHIELFSIIKGIKTKQVNQEELNNMEKVVYILTMLQTYLKYEPDNPYPLHKSYPSPRSLYPISLFVYDHQNVFPSPSKGLYYFHEKMCSLEWVNMSLWSEQSESCREQLYKELELENEKAIESISFILNYDFENMPSYYNYLRKSLAHLEIGHLVSNVEEITNVLGIEMRVMLVQSGVIIHLHEQKNHNNNTNLLDQLERTFFDRTSGVGPWGIYPLPHRISHPFYQELLGALGSIRSKSIFADFNLDDILSCIRLSFSTHQVDGVEDGVYDYDLVTQKVECYKVGNQQEIMGQLFSYPNSIHFSNINIVFCFSIDTMKLYSLYGEQYFAFIQVLIGYMAEKIILKAGVEQLFARPYKSFYQYQTDQFFGQLLTTMQSQYKVMIGKNRFQGLVNDLQL